MSISEKRIEIAEDQLLFYLSEKKKLGLGPYSKQELKKLEAIKNKIIEYVIILDKENYTTGRVKNFRGIRANYLT